MAKASLLLRMQRVDDARLALQLCAKLCSANAEDGQHYTMCDNPCFFADCFSSPHYDRALIAGGDPWSWSAAAEALWRRSAF